MNIAFCENVLSLCISASYADSNVLRFTVAKMSDPETCDFISVKEAEERLNVLKLRQEVTSLKELVSALEIRLRARDKSFESLAIRHSELTKRFIDHDLNRNRHKSELADGNEELL